MFLTVTPNPSFDKTLHVDSFERGGVERVSEFTLEAGGKGINVARALALAGSEAAAIMPASLASATEFAGALGSIDGLDLVAIDSGAPIRTNITIAEADGSTTKFNESGVVLDDTTTEQLIEETVKRAVDQGWVAVCGSHPPGFDPMFLHRLRSRLPDAALLGVDASGAALKAAVEAGVDLIKPNREELEALLETSLPTLGDVIEAAGSVRERGVASVLVSLGADGAVLVDATGATFGRTEGAVVANTVGAGDAFFAGFLSAGATGQTGLREALAWGHAAVGSPTTAFPPATDANRAAVTLSDQPDPSVRFVEAGWRGNG